MQQHTHGPDDLPEFLCRVCHPELNTTPEQRAALDAEDRAARETQQAIENRDRELRRAEMKLLGLTKNEEPSAESVSGKIAASLRRKIERLRAEAKAS